MSITVEFSRTLAETQGTASRAYESLSQLRDSLKSAYFAHVYRVRTHQNEFGRVTSRELLAIHDDGQEVYLGNVEMPGDCQ